MTKKNTEKAERKAKRQIWTPYYQRITKDKTKYSRKDKHKAKLFD